MVSESDKRVSMSSSALKRVIISTKKAPDAIGPYNQAVLVDYTLYVSGQIGFLPSSMEVPASDLDLGPPPSLPFTIHV